MAKMVVTSQKANMSKLAYSEKFKDFSLPWDTDQLSSSIDKLKDRFKDTLDLAFDVSRGDAEYMWDQISGMDTSNVENYKSYGWFKWEPAPNR